MSERESLKPCPFCGETPRVTSRTYVADRRFEVAHTCDATRDSHRTVADAITAWNTRARPEPSEAVVEELRAMIAVMELEHARTCAGRVCDCDLEDTRGHRVRSARAAIAAYEAERGK